MKYIIVLISLLSACLLSGCLIIEEKIIFNKDGSGLYANTIDLSELLSNPMMKGLMMEEMQKNGNTASMRTDSVIDIYGQMAPLNPQWSADDHRLMKKISARMLMDFISGEGGFYLNYAFEDDQELSRINELMASSKKGEEEDGSLPNLGSFMGAASNQFSFDKKRWTRNYSSPKIGNVLGEGEEADMAKMMFEEAKFVFTMEFPGKIKKVNGFSTHSITGDRTLRLEIPFLEMLENTKVMDDYLDGSVKYK